MRFRPTFRFLGRLLLILAVAELVPLFVCLLYADGVGMRAFAATAGLTGICGGLLVLIGAAVGSSIGEKAC